ncbi:type II CAAX endopeptidase family protein [Kamptonema sp. UHCC 0994]|uniref:CPBP family intramembrane glutamic endopeptidase n=1 Tax=Kamptonema sp. UHCC 0994 TaxID=3031329 RepID=UPI0023BA0C11|nr:type II CAAX endopeptidase family protein [Kamptonema sp. UHCC 0994]MDF0555959.1 type II CAAX endopeptidase family protein [Kamptonema sp. UHCC 0994]
MTEKRSILETVKRLILVILTVGAIALVGLSLLQSWNQPQIQSRLELYQTNLLLHAAEWQGENSSSSNLTAARTTLVGDEPFKAALKQYQEAQQSAKTSLEKKLQELANPELKPVNRQQLPTEINGLKRLSAELGVRLGLLQVQDGRTDTAIATWEDVIKGENDKNSADESAKTAKVLLALWSNPAQLLPNAQPQIQKHLDGWFRYRALSQLYQLQERFEELRSLQASEQFIAEQAVGKLAIVTGIPGLGFLIGIGLLVFLGIQWLVSRKQLDPANSASGPILLRNGNLAWDTPWDGETIWEVLVFGFFFVGQILIPLLVPLALAFLQLNPTTFDARTKAFYILANYVLLATGGISVLFLCIKPFLPLPEGWFRVKLGGSWFLWGLGGYFVALPLVILVSLINQQIWQGKGGSNPILPIALESKDGIALAVFFATASIAAPIFEEIIFRGFLLPSLTRYLPVWGAIALSGFVFAIAHLNASEVLPLATLGIILGFVYTRSRNLLAPMLLHSLWNSGTLLSLFILGSGTN